MELDEKALRKSLLEKKKEFEHGAAVFKRIVETIDVARTAENVELDGIEFEKNDDYIQFALFGLKWRIQHIFDPSKQRNILECLYEKPLRPDKWISSSSMDVNDVETTITDTNPNLDLVTDAKAIIYHLVLRPASSADAVLPCSG